jgi:hypothetical protein
LASKKSGIEDTIFGYLIKQAVRQHFFTRIYIPINTGGYQKAFGVALRRLLLKVIH